MAGRAPKLRRAARNPGSLRFAIVAARFNERITQRLVAGALQALRAARLGPDSIEVHWVPGSFELPQAASPLAATGRHAGIVCVGVVIRRANRARATGQDVAPCRPHAAAGGLTAADKVGKRRTTHEIALQLLYQLDLKIDVGPTPHEVEFWPGDPGDADTRVFGDALVR